MKCNLNYNERVCSALCLSDFTYIFLKEIKKIAYNLKTRLNHQENCAERKDQYWCTEFNIKCAAENDCTLNY